MMCGRWLKHIVGFPKGIAFDANVQIFQILVVVSHVNDFGRSSRGFDSIRLAAAIWTFHVVDARQCGILFGVWINNVLEFLFSSFHLGIENTDTLFRNGRIHVFAIAAVIG